MKKQLFFFVALGVFTFSSQAQTRLSLFEEFTGENCGPCAYYNPGLQTLLNANTGKVIFIAYQSPIPTPGPIYPLNRPVTTARINYYGIHSAPSGRLNGTGLGTGPTPTEGHVAKFIQSDLDNANTTSPFGLTVNATWDPIGDSIRISVNLSSLADFAPAAVSLKLRIALVEHLYYATPPGTNGEKEFHNVVRQMYPNSFGTALANSWKSSQSQVFTISGKVPAYVDKTNLPQVIVWVQNDSTKEVLQSAISAPLGKVPTDLGITGLSPSSPHLSCPGGTLVPSITLKNTGTNTIHGCTIWYSIDSRMPKSQPWSGILPGDSSTTISLNGIAVPSTLTLGMHNFYDSIIVNGGDMNFGNNVNNSPILVTATTDNPIPSVNTFENGMPPGWHLFDYEGNGETWIHVNGTGYAHNLSTYMLWYRLGVFTKGNSSMIIVPTPAISGPASMDFWVAYAQNDAANKDKLEVVTSADCGNTWTVLWSKEGSALATTSPKGTSWLPNNAMGSPDWVNHYADLSHLPANSLLAFRVFNDGGNNMYLDDIKIHSGVNGVAEVTKSDQWLLTPNPATNLAKLTFESESGTNVQIEFYDALGRFVKTITHDTIISSKKSIDMNTSDMASGLYNVRIVSGETVVVKKLYITR